jgi:hypothetical protein
MAAYLIVLGFWLQEPVTFSVEDNKLLMAFVGIVALAALAQAIILLVMAVGVAKVSKRMMAIVEDANGKVMPLVDSVHTVVRDSAPKVKIITENLTETSHIVRSKAQEFDVTFTEVNQRAGKQAARVDGMVTSVLDATTNITTSVQRSIQTPIREFAGLMNGIKAGIDVLVGRARGFGGSRTTANSSNANARNPMDANARNPMDGGTDLVR